MSSRSGSFSFGGRTGERVPPPSTGSSSSGSRPSTAGTGARTSPSAPTSRSSFGSSSTVKSSTTAGGRTTYTSSTMGGTSRSLGSSSATKSAPARPLGSSSGGPSRPGSTYSTSSRASTTSSTTSRTMGSTFGTSTSSRTASPSTTARPTSYSQQSTGVSGSRTSISGGSPSRSSLSTSPSSLGGRSTSTSASRVFGGSMENIRRRFGPGVRMDRTDFARMLADVGPAYKGVADQLFAAFDRNNDGRLDASEIAGGLAVLSAGTQEEKLGLMFELYNGRGGDSISRTEMQRFMDSMFTVAVKFFADQMRGLDSLLTNPTARALRASSGSRLHEDMQHQLRTKLKVHANHVLDQAFRQSRTGQLSKYEFTRWAQSQPKLFRWLTELGKKWSVHLKKSASLSRTETVARRKFSNIRLDDVERIVRRQVRGRYMSDADVRAVLEQLQLKNKQLKRRIQAAFSDGAGGEISTHEFCTALCMLCSSGSSRSKLDFAFRMFDLNGDGSLSRDEVQSFVQNFLKLAKTGVRQVMRSIAALFPGEDDRFMRDMSQLTDARIRQFTDKVVEDAMRYASGRTLTQRGFSEWTQLSEGLSMYLQDVGTQFLDSIDDDFNTENDGVTFRDDEQWESAGSTRSEEDFFRGGSNRESGRSSEADFFRGSNRDDRYDLERRDREDRERRDREDRERRDREDRERRDREDRDRRSSRSLDGVPRSPQEKAFLDRMGVKESNVDRISGVNRVWRYGRGEFARKHIRHTQDRRRTRRPKQQWHRHQHLRFLQNWDTRKIAKVFSREARGGAMQYGTFCKTLSSLGVKSEAVMKGLFDAFDRNGDGAINLDEFTNGIAVLTTGDFREKVRLAFESFDRNHTGSISKSDLQSYLKSFYVVVRETIQRVTATVSDVFGIDATDSQLFTVSSQHRMSFGKRFSSGMDRHLQDLMRRMADAAFRRAKDGYEGGGNLSLTDFERWAEDQPTLIQWYEHLGEQWLSSIHAKSKSSSVFSNRASRQSLLRRAFQEMDLRSLVRDLQRRGTAWEQISKRDFEDIVRSHVGLPTGVPSVAILGKLFSAFDVENAGRIDVREAVAGLCLLGIGVRGHSERNSMHMLFDMFDRDKSGTIERSEMEQTFRAFFLLAFDVANNTLLNCTEIFGGDDRFVEACFDQIEDNTSDTLDRIVTTIFRKADTSRDNRISWAEFERWERNDNSLSMWMASVADMWCESIVADESLFPSTEDDFSEDHYPGRYPEEEMPYGAGYDDIYMPYRRGKHKKKNKYRPPYFLSGPLAPVPGGLGAMGYPYQSYLKKIFSMTLISHRTNHKKFTYHNPYAKRTCFSFHSSNPNIIEIKQPQLVVPPNQDRFARLTFHPATPGNSECLLYIHNDDADRNEECIRFDISYMKDATNPYDKFAGLYGAKTYWGYDGADTGDDPFEARTWEQRPMGGRRRPAEWNGFDSDYFDEPDYRPRREPRREPGRGIDRDRREEDFLREGQERSFLSPKRDDFDRRSREEDFLKGGSREPARTSEENFFADGRRRSMGRGNDDFLPKQESDFFARASPSRSSGSGLDRQKTTPTEFLDRGRRKTADRDEPLIARAGGSSGSVSSFLARGAR